MLIRKVTMHVAGLAVVILTLLTPASAQPTDVRFVLDFLLQGQQSPFVLGRERGYYAAQGVNFKTFEPGRGGADSITKIASGVDDIGFGDLSSLIEFNAKNPGQELIAVLMVYDRAPLALISLKKSGISKPADLAGRKGGAPSVDAAFRLFNVFARVNRVDPAKVSWVGVQPQVREPMLVRGDIDFSAGWSMAVVPGLLKLGIPRDDINVMMMNEYGLDLYANAVFTTPAFAKRHPEAVRGFVKATIQSWLGAAADPGAAIAALKKAEPLSDPAIEMTRLKAALDFVITPRVRANAFGDVDAERLKKHIEIVTTGFHLPRKPLPQEVFDSSYLPPLAERKPK
ncbi:MAG: ABC transporter substrate-binding protein [Rhizobiales bacterium]|jgi:NitT/TauT family transport system substrate-binding protein|nr:ABC transporter substrate-binding protein [Hyphomicrobiales bacterium]